MDVAELKLLDTSNFKQIEFDYDHEQQTASIIFNPIGRPCFNLDLLEELEASQQLLKNNNLNPTHLLVLSNVKGVFSFGGDLRHFARLIRSQDLMGLSRYMKLCIDVLMSTSYLYKLEKIAVVQGAAFGGGFEAALSCSTIIAERSAQFGFPERLFNLFPGMGAYSYLIRRVSPAIARRIISCTERNYTAQQMYDMGIVDMVVEDGTAREAAMDYVRDRRRYQNAYNAIREVTDFYHKVDYDELYKIGEKWVKAALQLSDRDLRKMDLIGKGQDKYIY
ncbi:MAG: crotonase/enoyl-CoA hydratase family protein [Gammaproteobacteria bacterium]|jgi:DSF synthase